MAKEIQSRIARLREPPTQRKTLAGYALRQI
jgi:hypothetical protein